MHFGPARTKVNLTVIAPMVACTFPKTPAHARLWPSPGASPGTPVDLKVSSGTTLNHRAPPYDEKSETFLKVVL